MYCLRGSNRFVTLLSLILFINVSMFTIRLVRKVSIGTERDDTVGVPGTDEVGCRLTTSNSTSSTGANTNTNNTLVPNIVHYIWYTTEPRPLFWHQMLCIFSAHKVLRPDVIYFHTNMEPTGPYWERVRQLPRVRVMLRQPPTMLFGEKVKEPVYYTSHSNVDRVKILMEQGGIYLDLDMLVLKPFDDLRRRYECTIGQETDDIVCGSIIICSRHSLFLTLWINSYLDDYRDEWAYNTGKVPFNLARRFPQLVHVDEDRFNRPNFEQLELIWSKTKRFNWRRNYGLHLYYRLWRDQSPFFDGIEPNDENIKTWNASFGEMARMVLFGSPQVVYTDVS